MIAVIDYGVGNLFSLCASLKYIGAETMVTGDPDRIKEADKVILPGVGAFEDAKKKLDELHLTEVIREEADAGKPILGICLGMQMLFEKSYEYGIHEGLGLLKGEVASLRNDIPNDLSVPHIGWSRLSFTKTDDPLTKYIHEGDYVYFVHSYYAKNCENSLIAYADYGTRVAGYVHNKNIYGTQFHPEKSGEVGLNILRAFSEL